MIDELEHLAQDPNLLSLLSHYAAGAGEDRETWQDRVMTWDGLTAPELIRLHGELLAFSWLEQNTGVTTLGKPGTVCACYRPTLAGLRAVRQAHIQAEPAVPQARRRAA